MKDHLPILLIAVPLAGAWFTLLAGFFSYRLSRWTTYGTLLTVLYLLRESFPKLLAEGPWRYALGGWAPPWGIELALSSFSALWACLILGLAGIAFFHLRSYGLIAGLLKTRESLAGPLLLILVAGLLGQFLIRDGFTLYLFLQISMVASAGLILCLARQGLLDGFYFLLAGSVGASLLLAGVLFLYAVTGTLHLDDLLAQLFISKNFPLALGAGLFMTAAWGFLFVFPSPIFFKRFLDQTPPFLLGLFSSVVVRTAVFVLFLILFYTLNVPGLVLPDAVMLFARLLVLLFLAQFILAARQKDFLHSAAYLSVAQLGYLFIGFLLGDKSALTGTLMEALSQMLVVMGLFMAVGILSLKPTGAHPFSKLAGLGRHDFSMALILIIFIFSIVGVPPTGGFFGKFYLVQALMDKHDWFLMGSLSLILVFNLVSAARFTWLLFEHRKAASFHAPISFSAKAPLLVLAMGVLLLGIFHQEIIHNFIEPALPKAYLNTPVPNVPFLGKQVE